MMSFPSLVRYLQGERPGMSAWILPDPTERALVDLLYPDTLLAQPIAIQTEVQLADVSFWQEEVDFAKMKAAGLAGTIIRAGQRTWVDSRFKENWQKAKKAALPRGSYWFYDSREDPKKQAELWWAQVQDDPGELVHVADFEESYSGAFGGKEHFKAFLQRFQELSHLPDDRITIYTGFYWWLKRVGDDPYFRQFPLWLAWYALMSVVKVPPPWIEADLIFWQHTDSGDGPFYGVSSREIDLNYYCCDLTSFLTRFELGDPQPPNGDTPMDVIELRSTDITKYRTIRAAPSVIAPAVTATPQMPAGSVSVAKTYDHADYSYTYPDDVPDTSMPTGYRARRGDLWRKIFEMNGQPANGWMAEIHLGVRYLNTRLIPGPTPDPTVTVAGIQIVNPESVTITYSDGTLQTYP